MSETEQLRLWSFRVVATFFQNSALSPLIYLTEKRGRAHGPHRETTRFAPQNRHGKRSVAASEGSVNTLSLAFAEGLYADYLKDPELVSPEWQQYFRDLTPDAEFSRAPSSAPASERRACSMRPRVERHAPALNGNGAAKASNGYAGPGGWNNGVSLTSRFAKIASTR